MSAEQKDNRTASQRLDDVEKVAASLYSAIQQLVRVNDNIAKLVNDIPLLKEAAKLLNKRIDAVVTTANETTGINLNSVASKMIEMNVQELKEQVTTWELNGDLSPAETVTEKSFVVAEELTAEGTVANPRVQFPFASQNEDVGSKILGKKAGDTAEFGEGKFRLRLLEVYQINEPKPASSGEATPVAEVSVAETAPADDQGPTTTSPASNA